MSSAKTKDKREAWVLLPDCGHLVLTEPPGDALSPAGRTLDILLGDDEAGPCPCCDDPANPPMTIRNHLFMCDELRKHRYARSQQRELARKARIAAGEEAVVWSLNARYLEGIIEGAKAKPTNNIVYENHFSNEQAEWKIEKLVLIYTRNTAIAERLRQEPMAKLELMLTRLRHEVDYNFAFAKGKLLGQRWAEARGEMIPSVQLGPEIDLKIQGSSEPNEQARRRSSALALLIARRIRARGHVSRRELRRRYKRRLLVRLVRIEEQSVGEAEQIASPVETTEKV